jgi:hypothetical protein
VNNLIVPFGLESLQAKVYRAASRSTARNALSSTTLKVQYRLRWVRDEIREIEPGVYLGKFYFGTSGCRTSYFRRSQFHDGVLIKDEENLMSLILLIILMILIIGALPTWPYSAGWGYYPSRGLGLVLLILVILLLFGRI